MSPQLECKSSARPARRSSTITPAFSRRARRPLVVLTASFSVLRIYMLVFSGMLGFILFILALLMLSYLMIWQLV